MIKNIIFDVAAVLVNANWKGFLNGLGIEGEDYDNLSRILIHSETWNQYFDKGTLSDEGVLERFLEEAPEYEKEIRLIWSDFSEFITRFPYTDSWLDQLKEKGYHTYILSNYPHRVYEHTKDKLAFEKKADGVVFSFQVKQIKPDREIYETVLNRYGLVPEECVFVDDRANNLVKPEKLGIHTIQFISYEQVCEDMRKLGVNI